MYAARWPRPFQAQRRCPPWPLNCCRSGVGPGSSARSLCAFRAPRLARFSWRPSDHSCRASRATPSPRTRSHTLDADNTRVSCDLVSAYGLSTGPSQRRSGDPGARASNGDLAVKARKPRRGPPRRIASPDSGRPQGNVLRTHGCQLIARPTPTTGCRGRSVFSRPLAEKRLGSRRRIQPQRPRSLHLSSTNRFLAIPLRGSSRITASNAPRASSSSPSS